MNPIDLCSYFSYFCGSKVYLFNITMKFILIDYFSLKYYFFTLLYIYIICRAIKLKFISL